MLVADQLELDFFHEPEPAAVEVTQRPNPIEKNEIYKWLIRHPTSSDVRGYDKTLRQGFSDNEVFDQIEKSELIRDPEIFVERKRRLHPGVDEKAVEELAVLLAKLELRIQLNGIKGREFMENTRSDFFDLSSDFGTADVRVDKLEQARDEKLFNTESFKFLENHLKSWPDFKWNSTLLDLKVSGVLPRLISINPRYSDFVAEYARLETVCTGGRTVPEGGEEYLMRAKTYSLVTEILEDMFSDKDTFELLGAYWVMSDRFKKRISEESIQADRALKNYLDLKAAQEVKAETTERIEKLTKGADEAFIKYMKPNEYNRDGTRKLEDFGEDLNNTRKGRGAVQSKEKQPAINFINLTDWQIENYLSLQPLEKVWPMQSIHDLYKTNPEGAAFLYLLRCDIGKKPRITTRKYQRYVEKALTAIRVHQQLLTKVAANHEVEREFFDGFYGAARNYKLWSLVEPKFWNSLEVSSLMDGKEFCRHNDYFLSDGSDINSYTYSLVVPCKQGQHDGCLRLIDRQRDQTSSSYVAIVSNDLDDLKNKLNNHLQRFLEHDKNVETGAEKESKPLVPVSLFGRYQRGEYEVYGKIGTIELQLTDKLTFENDKAFTQYVKDHQQELSAKYHELRAEYSKTEKDWRGTSPIRERIGRDWRQGKDATPEMFMQAFGFRGVEFGNWVRQGKNGRERQWMLNNAYDSLCDLASILNIPTRAVALDGSLGLCFGSRGFGSASAHYEPENRIINLTKTKGYSSLAHEWFHALDHYMAANLYEHQLKEKYFMSDRAEPVNYGLNQEAAERIRKEIGQEFTRVNIDTLDTETIIRRVDNQLKNDPQFKQLLEGSLGELSVGIVCTPLDNTGYRTVVRKEVHLTRDDISQKELTPTRYEFTEEAEDRFIHQVKDMGLKTNNPERAVRMILIEALKGSSFNDLLAGKIDKISIDSQESGFYTTDGSRVQLELKKEDFKPVMVRPEVFHAWGDTIEAIRNSSMHQRMIKKNAYWQSKIEEAARSFEAFIEVRCREMGIQNDFLTRDVHLNKELGKESFYPYLNGKDVEIVKVKFEKLFKEIKTRETEKGVELFSKGITRTGANVEEIRFSLEKYFGKDVINGLIETKQLSILKSEENLQGTLQSNPELRQSAWEIKSHRLRKFNVIIPEGTDQGYFGQLTTNSSLYPSPIPLVLHVGEDKGKGWGFGQKHREGSAQRDITRALPDFEGTKDDADRNFQEIFTTLKGNFAIYETGSKMSLVGKKGKAIIFEKIYSEGTFKYLSYVTTIPNIKPSKLGKRIGSGHISLPEQKDSATFLQPKVNATKMQNDTPQLLGQRAAYDTNNSPRKKQDPRIKSSSDNRIQGVYDNQAKQAILIADNLSSTTAPAVLLHEIGVHMAYDGKFKEKMQSIIDAAPGIMNSAARKGDICATMAKEKLELAGIKPNHPNYKEEACAYLVESCAFKQAQEPKLIQWYQNFKSTVSIWLYQHGFRQVSKLTANDLVAVAKANIKSIAMTKDHQSSDQTEKLARFSTSKEASEYVASQFEGLNKNQKEKFIQLLTNKFDSIGSEGISIQPSKLKELCNKFAKIFRDTKKEQSRAQKGMSR